MPKWIVEGLSKERTMGGKEGFSFHCFQRG
jgi:hypothetical protein